MRIITFCYIERNREFYIKLPIFAVVCLVDFYSTSPLCYDVPSINGG
jgi:hypothetical protein